MVLLIAIIAILLAANPENRVLGLVSYAWAGFGAAFGPVVVISLYWRGMTRDGALAGMLTGAATVLVWKQYGWFGLYEMVPGVALATLAIWLISSVSKPPAASVATRFDRVQAELHAATRI